MSSILTVRLTDDERRILARRARQAGMKKATFVRSLIRDTQIITGADALADIRQHMGDERLRILPR